MLSSHKAIIKDNGWKSTASSRSEGRGDSRSNSTDDCSWTFGHTAPTVASPHRLSLMVAQQPMSPMMKRRAPTAMITTAGMSVYTSSKKWS